MRIVLNGKGRKIKSLTLESVTCKESLNAVWEVYNKEQCPVFEKTPHQFIPQSLGLQLLIALFGILTLETSQTLIYSQKCLSPLTSKWCRPAKIWSLHSRPSLENTQDSVQVRYSGSTLPWTFSDLLRAFHLSVPPCNPTLHLFISSYLD